MKQDLANEPLLNQKEFTPSDILIIAEKVKRKYENICSYINDIKSISMRISEAARILSDEHTEENEGRLNNLISMYNFKSAGLDLNDECNYIVAYSNALDESNIAPETYSYISEITEKLIDMMEDYTSFMEERMKMDSPYLTKNAPNLQ